MILYIDVETNGIGTFRPPTQRVMQISWIYDKEYNFFVNDVECVSDKVPHSITLEHCKKHGDSWDVIYNELERCMKTADTVVSHNADFDISSIAYELKIRKSKSYKNYKKLVKRLLDTGSIECTMQSSKDICKIPLGNGYKYPKLEELYQHFFGGCPTGLHDSLEDCRVMKMCHQKIQQTCT